MNKILNRILKISFCMFSFAIYSQCLNKVFHNNGTQIVNNVAVTVSYSGSVAYGNYFICDATNVYYFIGYQSSNGSCTFNFSPAVENASINIYRLDNNIGGHEEMQLFVNGIHYFITSPGNPTGCPTGSDSQLAVINAAGNLSADPSLLVGSMKNVSVNGPIQTLTVANHLLSGAGYGSFLELYICNPVLNGNEFESDDFPIVAPNPFSDKFEIDIPDNNENWSVVVTSVYGQVLKSYKNINGKFTIYRENLTAGVYLLQLQNERQHILKKIIVKD